MKTSQKVKSTIKVSNYIIVFRNEAISQNDLDSEEPQPTEDCGGSKRFIQELKPSPQESCQKCCATLDG